MSKDTLLAAGKITRKYSKYRKKDKTRKLLKQNK